MAYGVWKPTLTSSEAANDSDITFTVGGAEEWMPTSIWVELVAGTTVGNRQMCVEYQDDSADVIGRVVAGALLAASGTAHYMFGLGLPMGTAFVDTVYLTATLPEIELPAGYKVRVYDKGAIAPTTDDMVVQMLYKAKSA